MAQARGISIQVPPGVARSSTRALTPGRWVDTNLVRWRGTSIQPIGGWLRASSSPLPSTPRRMLPWEGNNFRFIGFLCDNHLFVEREGVYFDVTPIDFQGVDADETLGGYGTNDYSWWDYGTGRPDTPNPFITPLNYSLDVWGEELLALAYTDGFLRRWSPLNTNDLATTVPNAPPGLRTMVVTDERHVMCGHVNGEARRVAWSSREDYEDWNFASTTNTAGFLELATPGIITGMTKVREGVLVFTTADVWLVSFVGFPLVYGAERIATYAAPVSPQTVIPFEGRAVWMAREGFFLYDAGVIRPLPCEVVDFVYSDMDRARALFRAHGSPNGLFPEVWWWYPAQDEAECNKYVVWNYAENWWAIGQMSRSAACAATLFPNPFAASPDGNVFQHETGTLTGSDTAFAETGFMSISDENLLTITQIQPDGEDAAQNVRFSFFTRNVLDGSEIQHGPYLTRPDGYMDARFTARDARMRIEAKTNANWTVGKVRLRVAPRGKR